MSGLKVNTRFTIGLLGLVLLAMAGCSQLNSISIPLPFSSPTVPPPTSQADPLNPPTAIPPLNAVRPLPTNTASALPPATTESISTPSAILATGELPTTTLKLASPLLFISENKLRQWNHASGDLSVIAEDIQAYSASGNGMRLALLRSRGIVANGTQLYDLVIHDLETNTDKMLIAESTRLYNLALSPDGRWVAYTSQEKGGNIFLVSTDSAGEPRKIGMCSREQELTCDAMIAWAPGSDSLLWSDQHGVWMADPEQGDANLSLSNQLEIDDPKGAKQNISVTYTQLSWSPAGRFALSRITPDDSNVSWLALLDTRAGRAAQIPPSFEVNSQNARAVWLSDGRLVVTLGGDLTKNQAPKALVWSVVPTREEMLNLDTSFDLQSADFPELNPVDAGHPNYVPEWPFAVSPQAVSFGILLQASHSPAVLFTLDLKYGNLQQVNRLPADTSQVIWSPDRVGAVVLGQHGSTLLAMSDGRPLINLLPLFGEDAHDFTWLPWVAIRP